MSKSLAVAAVGLVAGALGSALVMGFSNQVMAHEAGVQGDHVVQVATSPTAFGGMGTQTSGVLFRVWSNGTVDMVGYAASDQPCSEGTIVCLRSLGTVPADPAKAADLNNDGVIDGADMGLLLGEWDATATAR